MKNCGGKVAKLRAFLSSVVDGAKCQFHDMADVHQREDLSVPTGQEA
jgi:hypothetical protein